MKRFVLPVILQIACMILQNVSALCQALPDKEIASRIHAYLKPFSETGNFIGTVSLLAVAAFCFDKVMEWRTMSCVS